MRLHERIGEIFLANETDEVQAAFSASLARFRVEDAGIFAPDGVTVRNELRVVLLVESPHTDEVGLSDEIHNRHPLEGSAGRHVRDILEQGQLDLPDEPIGRLVHRVDDTVRGLGIMNVSQLPFQETPYIQYNNDVRQNQCWNSYIRCMKHIKKSPGTIGYRGFNPNRCLRTEINRLQCAIVDDLRRRLRVLHGRRHNVLLARCGEVAQAFHEKTGIVMPHTCDLPHPTNHGSGGELWRNLNCEDHPLQEIINRLGPNPA